MKYTREQIENFGAADYGCTDAYELKEMLRQLLAENDALREDAARLDWLDAKNKGHSYYTGYVWQKEGFENNRGLVAAIQNKKSKMTARQAIDAARKAKP